MIDFGAAVGYNGQTLIIVFGGANMARRSVVVPYDEQWKKDFEEIKQYILAAASEYVLAVEHVGSTAVEGLSAKPIIDIDVVISDYSVFSAITESLAKIGYYHEGDLGIKDREAFDYQGERPLPKHHMYVCPSFSEELRRHISFRDHLRKNREDMLAYSRVKEEGARRYPENIDGYIAFKTPCIEKIYEKCIDKI